MAEETVIHSEGNILVSTTRVVIGSTTYALANLTSVSKSKTVPDTSGNSAMIAIGAIVAFCALVAAIFQRSATAFGVAIAAAIGAWLAAASLKKHKPTYTFVIQTSSGQVQALTSPDERTIDRIVQAVSKAITTRG